MERNSFLIVAKAMAADKQISATEKLLLAQLLDHRNKRTGQCNPNQTTLARELGIGLRTVRRSLSRLCKHGWLAIQRGQNGCRYEFPTGQSGRSDRPFRTVPPAKVAVGEAPYPLSESYLRNHSGVAAASSSQKQPLNASPPPRKSAQSEVLEAYYREERRKAGNA